MKPTQKEIKIAVMDALMGIIIHIALSAAVIAGMAEVSSGWGWGAWPGVAAGVFFAVWLYGIFWYF